MAYQYLLILENWILYYSFGLCFVDGHRSVKAAYLVLWALYFVALFPNLRMVIEIVNWMNLFKELIGVKSGLYRREELMVHDEMALCKCRSSSIKDCVLCSCPQLCELVIL